MRHFTLLIAGENPEELIKPYDRKIGDDRQTMFQLSKAEEYRKNFIDMHKTLSSLPMATDEAKENSKQLIEWAEKVDDVEFYAWLTDGYEIDEETGDAYTTVNKDGKFDMYNKGGRFALPMVSKDGVEDYSMKKSDVDWGKVDNKEASLYEFAWDAAMDGREPVTDDEKTVYTNFKDKKKYFEAYGTKDNYVKSNTRFWTYAFLSEETGWVDLDESGLKQEEWIDRYHEMLDKVDGDTTLNIYECGVEKEQES